MLSRRSVDFFCSLCPCQRFRYAYPVASTYPLSVDFACPLSQRVQIRSSEWYAGCDSSCWHTLRASSQFADASRDLSSKESTSWGSFFPRRESKLNEPVFNNLSESWTWPVELRICTSNEISSGSVIAFAAETSAYFDVRFSSSFYSIARTSCLGMASAAFDIMRYARVPNNVRSFSGISSCLCIKKHMRMFQNSYCRSLGKAFRSPMVACRMAPCQPSPSLVLIAGLDHTF